MKESKRIISQEPSKKPFVLTIKWDSWIGDSKNLEVFRNIKSEKAAKKILEKRDRSKMSFAIYNKLIDKETQEIKQVTY